MENLSRISILVDNQSGVLARVVFLFRRRGFNIKSLTVGETEDPALSRITIITEADDPLAQQIQKQLLKLEVVKKAEVLPEQNIAVRELLLIKVQCPPDQQPLLLNQANTYGARILSIESGFVLLELTDKSEVVDDFIEHMRPYHIAETCRTGVTAIKLGKQTIYGSNSAR